MPRPRTRGRSLTSDEKLLAAVLRLVEVSTDALHGWGVDELHVRDIPQGAEPFEHLWMDEEDSLTDRTLPPPHSILRS